MNTYRVSAITSLTILLAVSLAVMAPPAFAEVPAWIKNNAGWWAGGQISDAEFLTGIAYLITVDTITVPATGTPDNETVPAGQEEDAIPDWVRTNAGWWADNLISDSDFLNGIQHLIGLGLITVSVPNETAPEKDQILAELEEQLAECAEISVAYKRIDCERPLEQAIMIHKYKTGADMFQAGPIEYYWAGLDSDGNGFEISQSGQALLSIRILAENTSDEIQALNCTSPSLCNYDIWDGTTAFRYAGTDFTSGQIVLNPGDAREFNMLFGPNVGYGGSQFLYDESKAYHFRINESFGSAMIPLNING